MTGVAAAIVACGANPAYGWSMKKGPLMTRFAEQINPNKVLPEYPRPQLVRPEWVNLNGVWEFQPGTEGDALPKGKLSSEILVPFPVESAISGVMEEHDRLWYRRTFTVPVAWQGRQIILHFGAVDYESEVFVNGKSVGVHKGGYDPFSYDITSFLKPSGPQELIVRAFDPGAEGGQPRGKQADKPGGIMYTGSSGIWQTVWIEPVRPGAVKDLKMVPDVDNANLKITVNTYDTQPGDLVTVTAKTGNTIVNSVTGDPNTPLTVPIPNPKLWSPKNPFLYDLVVTVTRANKVVDTANSYFGMRKIEVADVGGVKKILLNGEPVFHIGPLDQGFWPDGLYTAPTEEAMKYDMQMMKDFGFNMIRKHIKVEPARWYYMADKLGLMVWQDMPSANTYPWPDQQLPPMDKEEFESELKRMVDNLYNAPSIVMWITFNEGQGQYDSPRIAAMVKQLDPSRVVNEASGWDHKGGGEVLDKHSYPPPGCPDPSATQALVCGEYGGIGLNIPGHLWKPGDSMYTNAKSASDMEELYAEFCGMLKKFHDEKGMSGAVYTQITDVETEQNGLMTYDRIPKVDPKRIARANRFEYLGPTYKPLSATSETESQDWRYTESEPPAGWMKKDFDDSSWKTGPGGFGGPGTANIGKLGTVWTGDRIWLRRKFNPGSLTSDDIAHLIIRDYHDEDVEIYINGVLAYKADGHNPNYENKPLTPEARKALKPGAENVLAVSCVQHDGGQYIDAGVYIRQPGK